jgi:small-conductance mechanosensitive channel
VSLKQSQPWVPLQRIEGFVQFEPALLILGLVVSSWVILKIFFRHVSESRKRSLHELFKNLGYHLTIGTLLFSAYYTLQQIPYESRLLNRLTTYIGLGTIFSGAVIFVKVNRVLVFEYLYLSHKKVPVLLVNLFTLLMSLILAAWIGAEIFNLQLAPLLATSAIFSLVLGLALQDTLGNLFAGVALQFDKPYEIGDWIEIQTGTQKWAGQVYEISWRATVLIALGEEQITVPNRVMGQAQISNFSTQYRPIIRSLMFKLSYGADIQAVKTILQKIVKNVPRIKKNPEPFVLVSETTESWVGFKVAYYIDNYGDQNRIADEVYSKALKELESAGFELSGHRLHITQVSEDQHMNIMA